MRILSCTCIISRNELNYCVCLYVNNVLYVCNCIHEKAIKPSCVLYLDNNDTDDKAKEEEGEQLRW